MHTPEDAPAGPVAEPARLQIVPWLRLDSFEREDAGRVVRLTLFGELRAGSRPPKKPSLVVRRGEAATAFRPTGTRLDRSGSLRRGALYWTVTFALPPALVDDARATFKLACEGRSALELPGPGLADAEVGATGLGRRRTVGALASAAVVGTAALLISPAASLADTAPATTATTPPVSDTTTSAEPTTTTPTTTAPVTPPPTTTTTPTTTTPVTPPPTTTAPVTPPPTSTTPTTTAPPPPPPTTTAPVTPPPTTTTTPPPPPTTAAPPPPPPPPATTPAASPATKPPVNHHSSKQATPVTLTPPPKHKHKQKHKPHVPATTEPAKKHKRKPQSNTGAKQFMAASERTSRARHHTLKRDRTGDTSKPSKSAGNAKASVQGAQTPSVSGPSATAFTGSPFSTPLSDTQLQRYARVIGSLTKPPPYLVRIYKAAARRYHLPWQVLAAINYVETGYGIDVNYSSAGAEGWMQFLPGTWREYGMAIGVRGERMPHEVSNPWNPRDAIFAAAKYLAANGAAKNVPRAIFAYNHAGWYVQEVLSVAEQIDQSGMKPQTGAGKRIGAMRTMAHLLNGEPYVWGGGHSTFGIAAGYDCSGFISEVLHAGGYLQTPVTTQSLPLQNGIVSGPGKWITIFDRTDSGSLQGDHVIIDIDGQWWESGGGTGVGGGADVHRIKSMNSSYLQSFNMVLHPRGL